jgi:hypothetical protein
MTSSRTERILLSADSRGEHNGPGRQFIDSEQNYLLNLIKSRNSSILAHGKVFIDEQTWNKMADWMEKRFIPMLFEESAALGIRKMPRQLPDSTELLQQF